VEDETGRVDVNKKILEEPEEFGESGTGKRKRDLMKRIRSTHKFTLTRVWISGRWANEVF